MYINVNVMILLLSWAFLFSSFFQNALFSTDMHWEKRWKISGFLSWMSPICLVIDSYFLSKQTAPFFEREWTDLWLAYMIAGVVGIQIPFAILGKWLMNKHHESKEQNVSF